jgi:four helix bundle protein
MLKDESPPKDLKIRTRQFALRILRLYSMLPKTVEAQVLGTQMLRSGTSVGAHYREGIRSRSRAEFVAKIEGGLQELEETSYWLELLCDAKIVQSDQLLDLQREVEELLAIFVSISKKTKSGIP